MTFRTGSGEWRGTGERVSIISISHAVIDGYEQVPVAGPVARGRPGTAMFRRRSLQPSRRAVLHVRAAGDPAVPSGLGDWFTERAFHYYLYDLAGLRLPGSRLPGSRLPGRRVLAGRAGGRPLRAAFAGLDEACRHLREADGVGHVIVSAHGRAALAVALWSSARTGVLPGGAADALILFEPALPSRPAIDLSIACPVLVLTSCGQPRRRPPSVIARLGSHVTWLQLPELGEQAVSDELGRWLGAYMYGRGRDQLL